MPGRSPLVQVQIPSQYQLLQWMFAFLRPVKSLVFFACLWLSLWVTMEILSIRQAGEVANLLNSMGISKIARDDGFGRWILSSEAGATMLRFRLELLTLFIAAYAILRYLREVANAKMSMNLVYYIREAVYDKLQRVGFGFHDALSSGQLINRALSDLQHVRQFVQTAVLTTLEERAAA